MRPRLITAVVTVLSIWAGFVFGSPGYAARDKPRGMSAPVAGADRIDPRGPFPAFDGTPAESEAGTARREEQTGTLTLQQALSLALLGNPGLSADAWEVRAAEARALQAGLSPNPELDLELENFSGSGDFRGFDVTDTTIQLGQLIELSGKRGKRKRMAALATDLARWDYEVRRVDVLAGTTRAFIGVLAAQERLVLSHALARLADQVFQTVAERVSAGKVSPVEETRAGITLAERRMDQRRAARELENARLALAAEWGSVSAEFERVAGDLEEFFPIPPVEAVLARVSENPAVARWSVELDRRRAAVELGKAGRVPDLTLIGGIRRFSETEDTAFVAGLSIPIPLFDRNQGGALEAKHRLAKWEEERRELLVRVSTSLADAYQRLATAHADATALAMEVLPAAQHAFDATREGYQAGKFSFLDVLVAQKTLFEARIFHIETLEAFHKEVAEVERLIGMPLQDVDGRTGESVDKRRRRGSDGETSNEEIHTGDSPIEERSNENR